jgi:ABC-2 type transport system permease protein
MRAAMFLRQFGGELFKLAARRRTWVGFGAFAVIELIMPALFLLPRVSANFRRMIEARGHAFEEYFSGLTIALLTMRATVFFIGSLYLAMVSGEIVAKEVEDGTMRMNLCRPVSRLRLLALRYLTAALYTVVLVWFIGLLALGVSLLYAGPGGFFAYGFQDHTSTFHPFREGVLRYLTVLPFLSLSLLTITSLGFMFSCFQVKPAGAIIGTLTVFFTDLAIRGLSFFDSIQGWLITTRMGSWMGIFQPEIPWPQIAEDYIVLLGLDASFFVIGWLAFQTRDPRR